MADFREISQSYAHGAIKAMILVNSGALVACLTQLETLTNYVGARGVGYSVLLWTCGVFLGALSWILGFLSTRFVDIADRGQHGAIRISNRYMFSALAAIVLSLLLFVIGSFTLGIMFMRV